MKVFDTAVNVTSNVFLPLKTLMPKFVAYLVVFACPASKIASRFSSDNSAKRDDFCVTSGLISSVTF